MGNNRIDSKVGITDQWQLRLMSNNWRKHWNEFTSMAPNYSMIIILIIPGTLGEIPIKD